MYKVSRRTFVYIWFISTVSALPAFSSSPTDFSQYKYINEHGYRFEHYRAPTPTSVNNAETIDTTTLQKLLSTQPDTILIDVGHSEIWLGVDEDFPTKFIPGKQRQNIPGSVWLPNVGRAELSEEMQNYLYKNLQILTNNNKNRGIVVYCIVDCWMSWNAVQRIASYGYNDLYWYPDGSDGWQAAGLPLQRSEPVQLKEEE